MDISTSERPRPISRGPLHLPAFVSELLGRHLQDIEDAPEALVFPAPRGGPLRYQNMRKTVWDRARERSDEDLADVTPHDLRHTCASLMRAAGADVKAIQQQLGHRNATVTLNTYTHLFEGDLAAVMDRLDAHAATESRPERVLGRRRRPTSARPNPTLSRGFCVAPGVGLEPTTYGLTVRRSAN